jgi:hypothetical protein
MTVVVRGDWVDRLLLQPDPQPIRLSDSVLELLLDACTIAQLRHLVAIMAARNHIPNCVAIEIANELGEIYAKPPIETEYGSIDNRPTVGWYRRRSDRIAEALAS